MTLNLPIHTAQKFTQRNAESRANCQESSERWHALAALYQRDSGSVEATVVSKSFLAEPVFGPELSHALAESGHRLLRLHGAYCEVYSLVTSTDRSSTDKPPSGIIV